MIILPIEMFAPFIVIAFKRIRKIIIKFLLATCANLNVQGEIKERFYLYVTGMWEIYRHGRKQDFQALLSEELREIRYDP
ncbi:hypothetical protein [Chaco virus]|uniref:Uncharacterized protein n=1 Tax=Chaco virus TaxID=1158189 RepID=A0A0D3R1C7_9RHAB|nr:hypothetical protein [Chaco virus]AJR28416.1 hypothetical protein [Chaco virus]